MATRRARKIARVARSISARGICFPASTSALIGAAKTLSVAEAAVSLRMILTGFSLAG
jgi:hypothetical protein